MEEAQKIFCIYMVIVSAMAFLPVFLTIFKVGSWALTLEEFTPIAWRNLFICCFIGIGCWGPWVYFTIKDRKTTKVIA